MKTPENPRKPLKHLGQHRSDDARRLEAGKKAEVLVSVIDRYLVLLTDTVTVSSLARKQRKDAEVAESAEGAEEHSAAEPQPKGFNHG